MKQERKHSVWLRSDAKLAIHPKTGKVLAGASSHSGFIPSAYDSWVRAIVFPSRKRVYFRFYKPDGDFSFVDESDKVKSFDVCYSAWESLIKHGYARKSWKPLFATTDRVVTEGDIKL